MKKPLLVEEKYMSRNDGKSLSRAVMSDGITEDRVANTDWENVSISISYEVFALFVPRSKVCPLCQDLTDLTWGVQNTWLKPGAPIAFWEREWSGETGSGVTATLSPEGSSSHCILDLPLLLIVLFNSLSFPSARDLRSLPRKPSSCPLSIFFFFGLK